VIRVGVYGATGYTGYELVKVLWGHPEVELEFATSERMAGKRLADVFPCHDQTLLVSSAEAPVKEADAVFLCLPHGESMARVKDIHDGQLRIVDLSADFRLRTAESYREWYGTEHTVPDLLAGAVYGLPEIHRERIRDAVLVANPGCYPTSVILGLAPLVREGLLHSPRVIADSKSGASGAGRTPSQKILFVEVNENVLPYNIGHVHRHVGEMEQELSAMANQEVDVIFSPHLMPLNVGIVSTLYVEVDPELDENMVRQAYQEAYAEEPFVRVLEKGAMAHLKYVVGTNDCAISIHRVDDRGNYIIVSAIDNLIKGASGQAVQNLNVMFGWDETLGLWRGA
jgi:N-acetyl-gamma-glutamyl-phosphate reductase